MLTSAPITAGSCKYNQSVDNVDVSVQASVHGWWGKVGGTCPTKAKVTVYSQAYYCGLACGWVTVSVNSRTVKEGTSKRANARVVCAGKKLVGWQGFVDVDLVGVNDPKGYTYGTKTNIFCEPAW